MRGKKVFFLLNVIGWSNLHIYIFIKVLLNNIILLKKNVCNFNDSFFRAFLLLIF